MAYTKQGASGVLIGSTVTGLRNLAGKPYSASKVMSKVYYNQMIDPAAGKSRITLQVKIALQDSGLSFVGDVFFIGSSATAGLYVNGQPVLLTNLDRGDVTIAYQGAGEYSIRKDGADYTYTFETTEKSFSVELRGIGGRDQAPQSAAQWWSDADLALSTVSLTASVSGTARISDGVTVHMYQCYISDGAAWSPYRGVESDGVAWEDLS